MDEREPGRDCAAGDDPRPPVAWSQDECSRRTWAGRMAARSGRAALLGMLAAAAAVAVWIVGGILLAEQALQPRRHALDQHAVSLASDLAARHGVTRRDVTLMAPDGVLLRGWWFTRDGTARGSAVLLHGVATNRSAMLGFADLLLGDGYRVLAVDVRAHGASGGRFATYGVLERRDLRTWVTWIRERHPEECVYGIGASMGAAILLQTLGTNDFCAAIVEAPFATFADVAVFRIGRGLPLPAGVKRVVLAPFVRAGMLYARLRHGVHLRDADARPAVARTRVPVLIIHGTLDHAIPPGDAERLAAANPARVTLWTIDGGPHVQSWRAAPEEFPGRVLSFFAARQ
jgi:uncharacterized protein